MKKLNLTMLLFAILATICIMSVGIFIAEQNIIGIITASISFVLAMGFGFVTKKKMREQGRL
ncbi:YlaF family protein [Cytobacillus sp. IB215316]|uniref:YlaF family protein n=1 Tax=Cytobacillus sp. IB215316 TaxID=3097354 RepID=UPI002A16EF5F|nr:YlaF family protein [Cytobacillus sp. IB215316]MDX8359941.1 YlaF family protein [Cytobacillus sp. IB215316]